MPFPKQPFPPPAWGHGPGGFGGKLPEGAWPNSEDEATPQLPQEDPEPGQGGKFPPFPPLGMNLAPEGLPFPNPPLQPPAWGQGPEGFGGKLPEGAWPNPDNEATPQLPAEGLKPGQGGEFPPLPPGGMNLPPQGLPFPGLPLSPAAWGQRPEGFGDKLPEGAWPAPEDVSFPQLPQGNIKTPPDGKSPPLPQEGMNFPNLKPDPEGLLPPPPQGKCSKVLFQFQSFIKKSVNLI